MQELLLFYRSLSEGKQVAIKFAVILILFYVYCYIDAHYY